MRRHALTDRAFAALAAGRPALATIGELRRAEMSRRLLLLLSSGYAHSVLDPDDPAAVRATLEDPLAGAWLAARLRAPGDVPGAVPREWSRWLDAEHDGLRMRVRLEDVDERRKLLGLTPTGRLTEDAAEQWQRCFADAWRILVTRHRAAAESLRAVITCVVPVEPDPDAAGISATSADAFGAVAMSAPADALSLAVGLLHEAQHSLLNATGHLFDLHRRPRDLGYSPWRDDPRPASGILHGAYAYLAVTRFWRTEARAGGGKLATFEFCRWRAAVATTASRLLSADTLTPAGTRFVTALRDEVTPWLSEETPADISRLARTANRDHYAAWRLRSMTPDPADVALVAKAWHKGDPPLPVRSTLTPGTGRALPHSTRLRRIHDQLRTGNEQGNDPETALRSYSEEVDLAGLALAFGVEEKVETLAALTRVVADDPAALARWLRDGR